MLLHDPCDAGVKSRALLNRGLPSDLGPLDYLHANATPFVDKKSNFSFKPKPFVMVAVFIESQMKRTLFGVTAGPLSDKAYRDGRVRMDHLSPLNRNLGASNLAEPVFGLDDVNADGLDLCGFHHGSGRLPVFARVNVRSKIVAADACRRLDLQDFLRWHILTAEPLTDVPLGFADGAGQSCLAARLGDGVLQRGEGRCIHGAS